MILQLIFTYVFFLTICILAGYGEAYRIIDPIIHSKKWHNLQWIERIGIFVTGIALALILGFGWVLALNALLVGIIFFIIYDGIINVRVFERNFFYVSTTTAAITEKFAHWWIKVPLLVILSVINALLLGKLKKENSKNLL